MIPTFESLIDSIPSLLRDGHSPAAADFDWALHPGGSTIIAGVQSVAGLTEDHLRASYHVYMNYGNSSSATIMSVMNRLRNFGEGRENVVACAFGPGISIEMMILRRGRGQSPEEQTKRDEASAVLGAAELPEGRIPNGVNGTNGINSNGTNGVHGLNGTNEVNGILTVPIDDLD